MKADEIRERFLQFFQKRGHEIRPSDSLIPSNDPSVHFTGAGMNQFKDMFLGRGTLTFRRAVTSQKCLRTGDLEKVGRTSGHHTFFEMLGNFSFGDYFKADAIAWAWQFCTAELKIPDQRLFVSVYQDDDEALDIWRREIGLPETKITRLGEDDNFWPAGAPTHGPNGPCGPCSEIYYDFGARHGCGSSTCGITCPCNRYVEIWNLVFTQFERKDKGILTPLPQKNIDTGAGLERIAAVLQGVSSNFETDLFAPLITAAAKRIGCPPDAGAEQTSRLRRIADHARALAFCIADNALPGPSSRGYVVRRILRTALRDGVTLGCKEAFLHRLVPDVLGVMKRAYPYLVERRRTIEEVIKTEEEKFLDTLEKGNEILSETIERLRAQGRDTLSGEDAFKLHDTYGFPVEMTEEILLQHGMKADRPRFEEILHAGRARGDASFGDIFAQGTLARIKEDKVPFAEFLGYGVPVADLARPREATVVRLTRIADRREYNGSKKDLAAFTRLLNASDQVESAPEGTDVAVLLDRTPFYAESGGQVGDAGTLSAEGLEVAIEDCKKPDGYTVHLGRVVKGELRTGAKIRAALNAPRRLDIMRNHTGTHLLQAALRSVLGPHVQQAGSVVSPERLRFDFTHFKALTREELRKVEDWVNEVVFADHEVGKVETTLEEAKKRGAVMFFGEKYGERVRVVTVGPSLSVELCGGTHLERSGTIGWMRITTESSIGSGVRRIEAVTGRKAMELALRQDEALGEIARLLKTPKQDVPKRVKKLVEEFNQLKSRGGAAATAPAAAGDLPVREIGGEKISSGHLPEAGTGELRKLMDTLIKKKKLGAAILAGGGEKPAFIIGVREDLAASRGLKAGELAREVGKACGGGGGGREHQAQAGASDPSKIPLGFQTFESLVRAKLGG